MFSKKNKVELSQQVISTLISEGCVIDGNIKAPAYVRIDGKVTGDITIDEGLILGEKAVINGNIFTKEMIVYGTVNGDINAHSLEIKNTGCITGNIKTQVLQVETGGSHNGKLSMSSNGSSVSHKQAKAEAVPA